MNLKELRLKAGVKVSEVLEAYPDKRLDKYIFSKIESGIAEYPRELRSIIFKLCGKELTDKNAKTENRPVATTTKPNQCKRILDYIEKNGSITNLEGHTQLGIMNFTARISDLRASGIPICGVTEKGQNRFGEKITYKRYTIAKGDN